MKKLLALSTLVGATGLMVFGTTSCQKVKMGEEDNEKVVLTSSGSGGGYKTDFDEYLLDRVSQEFMRVRPGDIWYDNIGTDFGFGKTGHVGIVYDVVLNKTTKRFELKVIESNSGSLEMPVTNGSDKKRTIYGSGVSRGIVTPERFLSQESTIYRVISVKDEKRQEAANWCATQVGKEYPSYFVIPNLQEKKTRSDAENMNSEDVTWYCSELVWAAYQQFGVNLEKPYTPSYTVAVTPYGETLVPSTSRDLVEEHVNVSPKELTETDNVIPIVRYNEMSYVSTGYDNETAHNFYFTTSGEKYYEEHDRNGNYCHICGKVWPRGCGA